MTVPLTLLALTTNHDHSYANFPMANSSTAAPTLSSTRYYQNLAVLQRHDPSIQSYFDVFSHIALFVYIEGKWEKLPCEGAMLLFERNAADYPPYGFYIMNRSTGGDYIQLINPEDAFGRQGDHMMITQFPQYTQERRESLRKAYGENFDARLWTPTQEWLDVPNKQRGPTKSIILWADHTKQNAAGEVRYLCSYLSAQ
jgi:hypothetical protein